MNLRSLTSDLAIDFGLVDDRAGRFARQMAEKIEEGRSFSRIMDKARRRRCGRPCAYQPDPPLALWARGVAAGVWSASVIWFALLMVLQSTGTGPMLMGGADSRALEDVA